MRHMDLSCSTLDVCGGRVVFTKRSCEALQPIESHARFIVHKSLIEEVSFAIFQGCNRSEQPTEQRSVRSQVL
jgi:hypothetical protein